MLFGVFRWTCLGCFDGPISQNVIWGVVMDPHTDVMPLTRGV